MHKTFFNFDILILLRVQNRNFGLTQKLDFLYGKVWGQTIQESERMVSYLFVIRYGILTHSQKNVIIKKLKFFKIVNLFLVFMHELCI